MLDQRRTLRADVVYMLYKTFVFTGMVLGDFGNENCNLAMKYIYQFVHIIQFFIFFSDFSKPLACPPSFYYMTDRQACYRLFHTPRLPQARLNAYCHALHPKAKLVAIETVAEWLCLRNLLAHQSTTSKLCSILRLCIYLFISFFVILQPIAIKTKARNLFYNEQYKSINY